MRERLWVALGREKKRRENLVEGEEGAPWSALEGTHRGPCKNKQHSLLFDPPF